MNVNREEVFGMLREAEKRAGKRSPFYMAKYIMGSTQMEDGQAHGWCEWHVELGRQMWGLHMSRGDRRAGTIFKIEWARGTRKSTMVAAYVVTAVLNDPNERVVMDGDTQPNAAKKLGVIKEFFEGDYCQELYGDMRADPWTNNAIQVKRRASWTDATVTATGTETGKTGQHYTIFIPDDKQTKENSQTPEAMEKVHRDFDLYASLGVEKWGPDGRYWGWVCMAPLTVWGEKDLSEKIDQMEAEDLKYGRPRRVYTSRKGAYHTYKNEKGEEVDDETRLMFPLTLPAETLLVAQSSMTDQDFAYQYLLRRVSKNRQMFHKEEFIEHTLSRPDFERMHLYTTIDPAGLAINPDGKKEGFKNSDDCVVMTTAVDDMATLYCLEYVNRRMTREQLFEEIKRQSREYAGPWLKGVGIETYFKQAALKKWLMLEAANPDRDNPVRIKWLDIKQTKRDKKERIGALQPYAKNRKLRVRAGMSEYLRQFTKFPSIGIHDDLPDCQAMVLDIMKVPGKKSELEKWGSPEWREGEIKAGIDPKSLPEPEDIRTWRMVMREKDRMKRKRPGDTGYLTL